MNNAVKIQLLSRRNPPIRNGMAAWYSKGRGISGSTGKVATWSDRSGNGRDLVNADSATQPTYTGNTVLFNGDGNYLKAAAFTLVQPETIYIRFKQITWTDVDSIFAGNTHDSGNLYQTGVSPALSIYAGTVMASTDVAAVGAWASAAVVFNGASSVLQVGSTVVTGDAGLSNMGGFTLGANAIPTNWANVEVAEVLIYSTAHDAGEREATIAYLDRL